MERFTATDDKGMLLTMTIRKRPTFALAWTKFKYIFGDGNVIGVGEKIGGKIKFNIDLGTSDPNLGFTNACAIRMSYVFNQTGLTVPYMEGKVSSGENGDWYIFRVRDLVSFVLEKMGPPDQVSELPNPSHFKNKKGIIVFEVEGWSDATGHATLWNGVTCSDSCYFPRAQRALFWELK